MRTARRTGRWLAPLAAWSTTLGFAVLAGGCAAPAPAPWRWIEAPAFLQLVPEDLTEVDCRLRLGLEDGRLDPALELVGGAIVERSGPGLTVRGGLDAPRLALREPVATGELDLLQLEVSGLRRGQLEVVWSAAAGQTGSVVLDRAAGGGRHRDRFSVDLSSLREVAERVRIEIEPTTAAGEIVTVRELCLGSRSTASSRFETATRLPWKIRRGSETRDALLVPRAGVLARTGSVVNRSRFDFGVTLAAGSAMGAEVRVVLRTPSSERTLATRSVGAELAASWSDFSIEIPAQGDAPIELEIRVEPVEPSTDFAVAVSSPQVRGRRRFSKRPNILLISIDTLRADHLSMYGYRRETTPHLDAWARRYGTVFERAVTTAPWTLPSHFSLFTGLEGYSHPANYNSVALDTSAYSFLADELWRAGYSTHAVTGGSYVSPEFGLARGFEVFDAWGSKVDRADELDSNMARTRELIDGRLPEPFFLFLHTYEVHTPNPPREPWFSRFHGGPTASVVDLGRPDHPLAEKGFMGDGHYVVREPPPATERRARATDAPLVVDLYDSAVAFVDDRIGGLLRQISESSLAERTIVVLLADHGESLSEPGRAGHGYLSADNLLIPLVFALPRPAARAQRIEGQARIQDVFPTLLELAGVPIPARIDGRSLVGALAGRPFEGRVATSYATSTNRGLARIEPDGLKLGWRNFPWRATVGDRVFSRIRGLEEVDAGPAGESADLARRIDELAADYARRMPGLRLELENPGPETIQVEVVTDLVDPVSLKLSAPDAVRLQWLDVGRFAAEVEPGRRLGLIFERFASDQVSVAVAVSREGCERAARFEISSSLDELRERRSASLSPTQCRTRAAVGAARLGLEWRGPTPRSVLAPGDADLAAELRALGYLP